MIWRTRLPACHAVDIHCKVGASAIGMGCVLQSLAQTRWVSVACMAVSLLLHLDVERLGLHSRCYAAPASIQAAGLEQLARTRLEALRSIEFKTIVKSSAGIEQYVKQVYRGDCYRVELGSRNVSNDTAKDNWAEADAVLTFNGATYQQLRGDHSKVLMQGPTPFSPMATAALDPAVAPYYWLFAQGQRLTFDSIKDPAKWRVRFAEADIVEASEPFGPASNCAVVSMVMQKPLRHVRVWFAVDLGLLPVRWLAKTEEGVLVAEYSVSEVAKIDARGEAVHLPTRARYETHGAQGHALDFYTIADSIQVNHEIRDDVFHISPMAASRVIDLSARRHRNTPDSQIAVAMEGPAGDGRRYWIALNICAIVILTLVVLLRRMRTVGS